MPEIYVNSRVIFEKTDSYTMDIVTDDTERRFLGNLKYCQISKFWFFHSVGACPIGPITIRQITDEISTIGDEKEKCMCDACGHIGWGVKGQTCGACGFCRGTMRRPDSKPKPGDIIRITGGWDGKEGHLFCVVACPVDYTGDYFRNKIWINMGGISNYLVDPAQWEIVDNRT